MKQKDIALIAIIVLVSIVISFFRVQNYLRLTQNRQQSVAVVQPITADFPKPDSRYFNSSAFDPTKLITIGQNANPDPFSGTSQ